MKTLLLVLSLVAASSALAGEAVPLLTRIASKDQICSVNGQAEMYGRPAYRVTKKLERGVYEVASVDPRQPYTAVLVLNKGKSFNESGVPVIRLAKVGTTKVEMDNGFTKELGVYHQCGEDPPHAMTPCSDMQVRGKCVPLIYAN